MMVGFSLAWIGKSFRRRRHETDEQWRERIERQESMIDSMEELRLELHDYNEELKEFKRLSEESEGDVSHCYYLKGLTKAEQAEAMAAELEALIARYEREYGHDNAKV